MLWRFRQKLGDFIKDPVRQFRGVCQVPMGVGRDLMGDRDVEWGYVTTRLGQHVKQGHQVLDFGCGGGVLTCAAIQLGARVVSIDLLEQSISIKHDDILFRVSDVMNLDPGVRFDLIINCSTVEHVGLGGRFNSVDDAERDVAAMNRMHSFLKPGGLMLLTLPVGQDAVFAPHHRIYGSKRLPRLLAGYEITESMFWRKDSDKCWVFCDKALALAEPGSVHCYALGCMTLRRLPGDDVLSRSRECPQ